MILHVFQWLQLLVAIIAPVSFAQDTGNVPNCTDDQYDWTYNSMGQSPCYVADVLMTQCIGHPYSMVPLQRPGLAYVIPEAPSNPSCYCNSIWYSLISACAVCQNGTWLTWPEYILYCHSVVYLTVYPFHIPSNTSVPGWAYLNVTATNNSFDLGAASNLAAGLGVTAPLSFVSTSATSASAPTSPTSTSNSSFHSSETNAGTIAGGVIGGVLGGALISALLFWLYTKRKASRLNPEMSEPPPLTRFSTVPSPPPHPPTGTSAAPSPPPPTAASPNLMHQEYQQALPKTYDPDDIPTSSTFPRFRPEAPRGLLPNTEDHWGQVGQYYADIPEL